MQAAPLAVDSPAAVEAQLRARLASAMDEEVTMLDALREIFVAQREALATGNATALDDGVFAATRMVRTLDEARRRRHVITTALLGGDVDGEELDRFLTGSDARPVRRARERLRFAADQLRREVAMLSVILRHALDDNQGHLEVLLAGAARAGEPQSNAGSSAAYTRDGLAARRADGGWVVDGTL